MVDDTRWQVRISSPSFLHPHLLPFHSHKYVNTILSKMPQERLHLSTTVQSLRNINEGGLRPQVVLRTENGHETTYDHVILACHSDTALEILRTGGITDEEDRILGQFSWNRNEVVLHCDVNVSPWCQAQESPEKSNFCYR
jgi:predicted NAD/FAD-binding protein